MLLSVKNTMIGFNCNNNNKYLNALEQAQLKALDEKAYEQYMSIDLPKYKQIDIDSRFLLSKIVIFSVCIAFIIAFLHNFIKKNIDIGEDKVSRGMTQIAVGMVLIFLWMVIRWRL